MSGSQSQNRLQNRRARRSGNGTARAITRPEELNTVKEELNTVKEQINKLQEKLEQTIQSKGQLFSLNCRLVEDLKMANMPSTQACKVFESHKKAELHREIAALAILNKVTKADHYAFKTSILSRPSSLMQAMLRQKSTEKDLKDKVSPKDSGLEIRDDNDNADIPKVSRDIRLLIAENQALKNEVNKLKEELKKDQQIREGKLQVNAEIQTRVGADSGPISEKHDDVSSVEMTDTQLMAEETEKCSLEMQSEAATGRQVEQQDELSSEQEKIARIQQNPEARKAQKTEVQFESANEPESAKIPVNKEQEKISFETRFQQEEVTKSKRGAQLGGNDAQSNDNNPSFGQTDGSQRQMTEEESAGSVTGEIIIEEMANAKRMQKEKEEEVAEIRADAVLHEKNDHESVLEEKDNIISELEDENARLRHVNKDATALAEELELDRISSELSYKALLEGLKDNIELKMIDHQNEVQQFELGVKEEKKLREAEQAKSKALEEELEQTQVESKAFEESQNTEIKKLRATIFELESKYSKAQDDFQEETKHTKTELRHCSIEINDPTSLNAAQKHENNFLGEKLACFRGKLDNETSILRDEPTRYGDKLGKEEQSKRGPEESNTELYTQFQEQEDVISEIQTKKRRKKGWRRLIFCS